MRSTLQPRSQRNRPDARAKRLAGKVAVVVGGSQGIGKAIALAFAAEGARMVVAARRPETLQHTVDEILAQGGDARPIGVDVTDEVSVSMLFEQVGRFYSRMDVLVNSAGVGAGRCAIENVSSAQFDSILNVNLRGTFLCCRAGFQLMRERGGGIIINISSLAGTRAWAGVGPYCAAKHGIMGLTKALAHEGRPHRIRVTALCPGGVSPVEGRPRKDRDSQDLIEPRDVAAAAVFLAALSPKTTVHRLVLDQLRGSDW